MHLKSPTGLHYPIKVAKLRKQPGDAIRRQEPIFEYSYETTVEEVNRHGEINHIARALYSTFESVVDGKLLNWATKVGNTIEGPHAVLAEAEEECTHSVQYGGMCVSCGKDLTTMDYTAAAPETARAKTTVTPNHQALRISDDEAARSDEEAKQRLLDRRKLSLVVDLDLTIIHASVDPTIKEWMDDRRNPNHAAVSDVRVFDLYDEALQRNVSYYIKLRPNLYAFLTKISQLYELHIYTMGTRAYAENIAKLVDPNRKLFGERILSRTETPGEISKNLRKLFPVDNRMVVIIDDRADVWNYSNYLVRVRPFNFFVGIGDINSSFLPKQEDTPKAVTRPPSTLLTVPSEDNTFENQAVETVEPQENGVGPVKLQRSPTSSTATQDEPLNKPDADESALGQLVSMQEQQDASDIQRKTQEQDEELAAQLNERPLLQLQKNLEKQEEEAAAADEVEEPLVVPHDSAENETHKADMERTRSASRPPMQQTLLKDDDIELYRIEDTLVRIQRTFFNMFDERVEEDEGQTAGPRLIPDVKDVIEQHRTLPLRGCGVVFTRLVPLDMDVMKSRWADMAMRLGAVVQTDLRDNTTHVVCKPGDPTSKMREAAQRNVRRRAKAKPEINIVTADWLWESVSQWWQRVDEASFRIPVEPATRRRRSSETADAHFFSDTDHSEAATEGEPDGSTLQIKTDVMQDDGGSDNELSRIKSPAEEAAEWDEAFESNEEDFSDSDEEEEGGSGSLKAGSVRSVGSKVKVNGSQARSRKRRREDDSSDKGSDSDVSSVASSQPSVKASSSGLGSELQRRKRRALARTSSLTRVANAPEDVNGTKSEVEEGGGIDDNDDDDGDDGLEAAMREALGEVGVVDGEEEEA